MKKEKLLYSKLPAFSLVELLVVLCIIGILILVAYPNLMPLITQAKSTEAQSQLNFVHTQEKGFFYMHSKYSNDLKEIKFEQEKLTSDGGKANYRIEITEAGPATYKATATSVVDFDGDGVFNVWEIDQDKNLKETVQD